MCGSPVAQAWDGRLAHLAIFGVRLILPAYAADTFRIRDEKHRSLLSRRDHTTEQKHWKKEAHRYLVPYLSNSNEGMT